MRTGELAASCGVSTQTVRNLEARGLIPAADREPNGYRRYGQVHVSALHAYLHLSRAFDHAAAGRVLTLLWGGDTDSALDAVTSLISGLHTDLEEVNDLDAILRKAPRQRVRLPSAQYSIGELARHLQVRTSTLRVWEREGLLTPARDPATHYRVFTRRDVNRARLIKTLRRSWMSVPQIRDGLDEMAAGHRTGLLAERRAQLRRRQRTTVRALASLDQLLDHPLLASANGSTT